MYSMYFLIVTVISIVLVQLLYHASNLLISAETSICKHVNDSSVLHHTSIVSFAIINLFSLLNILELKRTIDSTRPTPLATVYILYLVTVILNFSTVLLVFSR